MPNSTLFGNRYLTHIAKALLNSFCSHMTKSTTLNDLSYGTCNASPWAVFRSSVPLHSPSNEYTLPNIPYSLKFSRPFNFRASDFHACDFPLIVGFL